MKVEQIKKLLREFVIYNDRHSLVIWEPIEAHANHLTSTNSSKELTAITSFFARFYANSKKTHQHEVEKNITFLLFIFCLERLTEQAQAEPNIFQQLITQTISSITKAQSNPEDKVFRYSSVEQNLFDELPEKHLIIKELTAVYEAKKIIPNDQSIQQQVESIFQKRLVDLIRRKKMYEDYCYDSAHKLLQSYPNYFLLLACFTLTGKYYFDYVNIDSFIPPNVEGQTREAYICAIAHLETFLFSALNFDVTISPALLQLIADPLFIPKGENITFFTFSKIPPAAESIQLQKQMMLLQKFLARFYPPNTPLIPVTKPAITPQLIQDSAPKHQTKATPKKEPPHKKPRLSVEVVCS